MNDTKRGKYPIPGFLVLFLVICVLFFITNFSNCIDFFKNQLFLYGIIFLLIVTLRIIVVTMILFRILVFRVVYIIEGFLTIVVGVLILSTFFDYSLLGSFIGATLSYVIWTLYFYLSTKLKLYFGAKNYDNHDITGYYVPMKDKNVQDSNGNFEVEQHNTSVNNLANRRDVTFNVKAANGQFVCVPADKLDAWMVKQDVLRNQANAQSSDDTHNNTSYLDKSFEIAKTDENEALFCSRCGQKLDNDSVYCSKCGQKVNADGGINSVL